MAVFEDLRIVKTRQKLFSALAELLVEKRFDQISVPEIAQAAHISRATFYHHFADTTALVAVYQQGVMTRIVQVVRHNDYNPTYFLSQLMPFLDSEGALLGRLLSDNGTLTIQNQFKQGMRQIFRTKMLAHLNTTGIDMTNETVVDYLIIFWTSAIFGVVQAWLTTGKRESPAELAVIFKQIVPDNLTTSM